MNFRLKNILLESVYFMALWFLLAKFIHFFYIYRSDSAGGPCSGMNLHESNTEPVGFEILILQLM